MSFGRCIYIDVLLHELIVCIPSIIDAVYKQLAVYTYVIPHMGHQAATTSGALQLDVGRVTFQRFL